MNKKSNRILLNKNCFFILTCSSVLRLLAKYLPNPKGNDIVAVRNVTTAGYKNRLKKITYEYISKKFTIQMNNT